MSETDEAMNHSVVEARRVGKTFGTQDVRVEALRDINLSIESREFARVRQVLAALSETPDLLLWTYLIFAVSNAMMPSPSDRRAWPAFLLLLALTATVLYLLGLGDVLLPGLVGPATLLFGYLGLAFSIAIGADVLFILLLFFLELLLSRLKGVRVNYDATKR